MNVKHRRLQPFVCVHKLCMWDLDGKLDLEDDDQITFSGITPQKVDSMHSLPLTRKCALLKQLKKLTFFFSVFGLRPRRIFPDCC